MHKADNLTTILGHCHVIWEPQLPGTLWTPRACNGTDFLCYFFLIRFKQFSAAPSSKTPTKYVVSSFNTTEQASLSSLYYGRQTSIARSSSHVSSEHNPVTLSFNLIRSARTLIGCLSGYSYLLTMANMNDGREVNNTRIYFMVT